MATAFDVMVAGVFADPNIASNAVYAPFSNSSATVAVSVVMVAQEDIDVSPFSAKAGQPRIGADIATSKLASPAEGDTLTVKSTVYTVASFRRDTERLVWRLMLREA